MATARVWPRPDGNGYMVVSETGKLIYHVFPYQVQKEDESRWRYQWGCTCQAAQGGYPSCYHKAIVYLLRNKA